MTQSIPTDLKSQNRKRRPRSGRIFPEHNWTLERIAKDRTERELFGKRCREIFDRLQPDLIQDHYNWFMIIEPESGDYFIHADRQIAVQNARQKYPNAWLGTYLINQTGVCGYLL